MFYNETIKTGPNLVTNKTLADIMENEQTTLLPLNDKNSAVGAIVPNTRGDTYNAALMAGAQDLARKINWTISNEIEVFFYYYTYNMTLSVLKRYLTE